MKKDLNSLDKFENMSITEENSVIGGGLIFFADKMLLKSAWKHRKTIERQSRRGFKAGKRF